MRGLGAVRARFHPDGSVAELELGPEPPPVAEPRAPPPLPSFADARQAEADRLKKLALRGLGGGV